MGDDLLSLFEEVWAKAQDFVRQNALLIGEEKAEKVLKKMDMSAALLFLTLHEIFMKPHVAALIEGQDEEALRKLIPPQYEIPDVIPPQILTRGFKIADVLLQIFREVK